ncbi:DUF6680 family protein [Caulobacter sp.]|uniref:DUF6680 family protein n=1 Tax=Caulobacter sp. TaxID=78 RepID=UPI002B469645|nr:DUF6680 family protein [Caulobacter sp.]HJV43172.1 DUF6680 family protein [Caulobacter sp.]
MRWPTAEEWQAIAGIATFAAACVAVWASFRAPKLAAEFAEKLRRDAFASERARLMQIDLLFELMKHRNRYTYSDIYPSLNLIDLVFSESPPIRQAWHQFFLSVTDQGAVNSLRQERYNKIIEEIVRYLGLGDQINSLNVQMAYVPTIEHKRQEVLLAEINRKWDELFGQKPDEQH